MHLGACRIKKGSRKEQLVSGCPGEFLCTLGCQTYSKERGQGSCCHEQHRGEAGHLGALEQRVMC